MTAIDAGAVRQRVAGVRPGRALLTAVAAALFGVGWLLARVLTGLLAVLPWCVAAVALGWTSARPSKAKPSGTPAPAGYRIRHDGRVV